MKKWIITAIVLTVVGGALFLFSFGAVDFDFSVLNEESLDMKLYRVEEPFHSISLEDDIADVTFVAATESKVEYTESDGITYSVSVSDGVLRIRANDRRKWHHSLRRSHDDGFGYGYRKDTSRYFPCHSRHRQIFASALLVQGTDRKGYHKQRFRRLRRSRHRTGTADRYSGGQLGAFIKAMAEENIPIVVTPPVFGILDPDASHRPTGSTTGYALRSG
jgi:hypothetical protein